MASASIRLGPRTQVYWKLVLLNYKLEHLSAPPISNLV